MSGTCSPYYPNHLGSWLHGVLFRRSSLDPGLETGKNCWAAVCIADLSGLKVFLSAQDMNREVVKTDSATTRIPELDFEIPAFSQKGGRYKVRLFGLFMPGCSPAF